MLMLMKLLKILLVGTILELTTVVLLPSKTRALQVITRECKPGFPVPVFPGNKAVFYIGNPGNLLRESQDP